MIAQKTISDVVGRGAQVFIGHSYGDDVEAEIKVTVIATGFGDRIESEPSRWIFRPRRPGGLSRGKKGNGTYTLPGGGSRIGQR